MPRRENGRSVRSEVIERGATCQLQSEPIGRMHLVRYAGASGDFNPIHFDDQVARAAGYDEVFGHGMLTAGVLSRLAADWFGAGMIRRFKVRFQQRLLLGDVLTCFGTIVDTRLEGEFISVTARLEARNQRNQILVSGEAIAVVPRRLDAEAN